MFCSSCSVFLDSNSICLWILLDLKLEMACEVSDGTVSSGLARIVGKQQVIPDKTLSFLKLKCRDVRVTSQISRKVLQNRNGVGNWHLSASFRHNYLFTSPVVHRRNSGFIVARNQLSSDYGVDSSGVEESLYVEEDDASSRDQNGAVQWKEPSQYQQQPLNVKRELLALCVPAIAGQAIEPFAQLMETAYIGRLGALELASAGISMNIFNYISKVFNIPLLSVATSFVAEDISKNAIEDPSSDSLEGCTDEKLVARLSERKQLSSVSTALLLAVGIGLIEALALYFGSGVFLNIMGISSESSLRIPSQQFLTLRALGAPAVVLYLTLQGVFRGFKETKTPVLCLGIGNLLAVCLFPLLIYYFQLGATGAAISTVVSQYVIAFLMLWFLNKRAVLLPPKFGALQFGVYMKSGGFLLGRTLSVLTTMTLGTSMAARQGAVAVAAHQICMQVWLAVSLLTDALSASSQAMIASSVSKGDYKTAKEVTSLSLKIGLLAGTILFAILGLSFGSLATLFTKDSDVLGIVRTGVLFVSATQPLNSLAFVFDGLHYGVSDFSYAAYSMMVVGAISSSVLVYASSVLGLRGLWLGLSLFMGLRAAAGFFRLLSKNGPWWFLHSDLQNTKVQTSP
ncbi:protein DETOXIFICATION 45, chloroplastic-like [Cucurbita moschata]|uniref:Protein DETOXIFICATION n=1 Tax=Cucurbita moschata TaxID=3662 RepID=A0A6J1EJA1_CUCMO|nr:protein DETOXIFICATION 45, chloroplastic-like [Cucurbita moschata]